MDTTAPSGTTKAGRRALSSSSPSSSSSLPWETGSERRRPSAYAHYKKLVHDFDALDEDLEQSRLAQEALEAQLQRHQDAVAAHAKAQHDQELAAWARERERRVEAICVHGSAVEQLRREQAALEEQELRLEAELDVLRERQQLANETEAKRVFDLVHVRTSLLEQELEKGRMDVEYLAQVISRAKQEKQQQQQQQPGDKDDNRDAIRAVVDDVRQRRQDALREATAQLQQRLQSFELEKAALQRKAEEIQWKKQRALQVLSTNQQQVIAGFFTTPRAAIQDANPPLPALEFDAIVQGLRQPTGDVVGRLQELEHGRTSGRRQQRDALADAQRNVEAGPARLDAIQRQMLERQQDALRLQIALPTTGREGDGGLSTPRAYDGAWSVETYRQEQFPIVYYVRSLVFAWMEDALEISRRQPATQLLEMEIKRHVATHAVLETLESRARLAHVAVEIADEVEREVVREMAASVLEELRYSGDQVREMIRKNLQAALFSASAPTKPANGNQKPSTEQPLAPTTLRWSMFEKAWAELSYQRDADASSTRRLPRLLMQPAEKTVSGPAEKIAASPTKKRFGLFGGASRPPPVSESPPAARANASEPTAKRGPSQDLSRTIVLTTEAPLPTDLDVVASHQEAKEAERDLWARHVRVAESSFSSLSTCAFVSSVQFSPDGQLLAVGTLDGEVVVFTMGGHSDEDTVTPTAMRASAPDKASSASSALGVARITRLCFSRCGRFLLSLNLQKVAALWTLAPSAASPHSAECFQTDAPKAKPPLLPMVSALAPLDLFLEPPVPLNVLEQDAPVAAARLQAAPARTIAAFEFFPSVSVTGEPTSLLCGASTGDFLKVALSALLAKAKDAPKWQVGSTSEAAFDLPRPTHIELRSTEAPTRELFRSAHRDSVVFVSAIASLAPASPTRLVSVDQRGSVALWSYARSNFSGFGWFVPLATFRLDLASTGEEILQIQLTPDRKTLVLMVFLTSSAAPSSGKSQALVGRLRFVQLDLLTNTLRVKPVRVELPMAGTIAPRFAVLRVRPPTRPILRPRSGTTTRTAPALASSGASSFLVLLMDNALHVLSLRTGELCRPAIPLHSTAPRSTLDGRARQSRKEPTPLLFNAIAAGSYQQAGGRGRGEGAKDHVAIVAVAGEQHRHVRLVRFHIRNTHS